MTEMRRVTIPLPDEIDKKIIELKKQDRFVRCSYSEIIRILIATGINSEFAESRGWTNDRYFYNSSRSGNKFCD